MSRPKRDDVVDVWWNGELHLKLHVEQIKDEPQYPGWVTIYGNVCREGRSGLGPHWEARAVFAQPQEDGSVRMLNSDERLAGEQA